MATRRVLRGLIALTVLTSFVAACGDDDDDEGTSEGTTTTEGAEVEAQDIDITAIDYSYSEAPTELDAGVVTVNFANEGTVEHEMALVEAGDAERSDFLSRFETVVGEEGGAWPDEAQNVAAPLEIGPGDTATATFTVNEGKYLLLCTLTGDADNPDAEEGDQESTDPAKIHFNRGMAQPITVNAGEDDADLPDADGVITAHDYTFDVDVAAGDETVNFTNTGDEDQVHLGAILEFPEGTTEEKALESVNAFFSADEDSPPPEGAVEPSDDDFGFTGVFSKGLGARLTPTKQFKSGYTYVIACFINDRTGGPPHALPEEAGGHGMVKAFTVE